MRRILLLLSIVGLAGQARALDDAPVFSALDAVGPLDGQRYDPGPVIRAVNMLVPLGRQEGVALLRRYIASRGRALHDAGPSALFVVLRTVFDPPSQSGEAPADACTPAQRDFAAGGCFRPPRLGAPHPAPPADLRSLRYPAFVLGDVPLSLVSGYSLGGVPERLDMQLEALASVGVWRGALLRPKSAGEVRYLFVHYGQWSFADPVGRMVEAQLRRLEPDPVPARSAAAPPCFDLGLWCVPRSARTVAEITTRLRGTPEPPTVRLEHDGKRIFLAFLELPTDSESYVHAAAWSYTARFDEWRLFLLYEVYGAVRLSASIDAGRKQLSITDHQGATALEVPMSRIPYSAAETR